MDACLIFNPAARGHRAADLRDQLTDLAGQCSLQPTLAPEEARLLARKAVQDGFRTIVAAGGDGTINEVLNGIGDESGGFDQVRLGILPVGTMNVFAKDLGLPAGLGEAWQVIQRSREWRIDLPFAEFTHAGQLERRYFIQLAGAGLDSRAIALVRWEQKKRWGASSYVLAGMRALSEQKPMIMASSATAKAQGELVLIGNGRLYGGKFQFFPQASREDGRLDILVYPKANWAASRGVVLGWITNRLDRSAGAIAFQAAQLTLTSCAEVALQLDGENVGFLPATFGVLPKTLRLLVP
jgi:diacylglycerol kinase (ATP)